MSTHLEVQMDTYANPKPSADNTFRIYICLGLMCMLLSCALCCHMLCYAVMKHDVKHCILLACPQPPHQCSSAKLLTFVLQVLVAVPFVLPVITHANSSSCLMHVMRFGCQHSWRLHSHTREELKPNLGP